MPFAALDDTFHSNRKIVSAGNEAAGVYARALSYCAAWGTDGFVPLAWADQATGGKRRPLRALERHDLWETVVENDRATVTDKSGNILDLAFPEPGFFILDYVLFNPSSVELAERHKQKSRAGRKGAIKRWGDSSSPNTPDSTSHSTSHSERHGGSHSTRDDTARAHATRAAPKPPINSKAGLTTEASSALNGLPIAKRQKVEHLLTWIGTAADNGTAQILAKHAAQLPEAALARVLESTNTASPDNRAGYIVAALNDELQTLGEP